MASELDPTWPSSVSEVQFFVNIVDGFVKACEQLRKPPKDWIEVLEILHRHPGSKTHFNMLLINTGVFFQPVYPVEEVQGR